MSHLDWERVFADEDKRWGSLRQLSPTSRELGVIPLPTSKAEKEIPQLRSPKKLLTPLGLKLVIQIAEPGQPRDEIIL